MQAHCSVRYLYPANYLCMRAKYIWITFGAAALWLASCTTTETEFRVLNRTPYELELEFKSKFASIGGGKVTLPPGMDRQLMNIEDLTLRRKHKEKPPYIQDYFKQIEVRTSGSLNLVYHVNIEDTHRWQYQTPGYQDHGYVLVIHPEDLE